MAENAANKLVFGTRGNDTIVTSKEGGDRVFASDGNDKITVGWSKLPNDIHGGQGDDYIEVITGNNAVIYGESGNDEIRVWSYSKNSRLFGNEGNDNIVLNNSNDSIVTSGLGDDHLGINGDNNMVNSGDGSDTVYSADIDYLKENNKFFMGAGSFDEFLGNTHNQLTVYGEDGIDVMVVHESKEVQLFGGRGDDLLLLKTNSHNSIISGGLGDDSIGVDENWEENLSLGNKIFGDQGNDWITFSNNNEASGGSGNDTFFVNEENKLFDTTVKGDSGNDFFHSGVDSRISFNIIVDGGSGNDSITAMAESSKLIGGAGQDLISIGGSGVGGNILTGGQGEDRYIITDLAGSNIIKEEGAAGEVDVIQFAQQGIGPSNVDVSRSGNNLALTYTENGDEETLLVDRFFTNGGYRVERFEFSDGTTWTDTQVAQMVQAMASVTNSSGAHEELEKNTEVQSIIIAADFR